MAKFEGRRLGNYKLCRLIGRGGMGEVYEGEDETLRRKVAVKVLLPALSDDAEFCERFLREAQSAAALQHPNICQIYAADKSDDTLFFVMEFVRGKTLAAVLDEDGRLPEPTALRIAGGVASALAFAHSKNIIHRDIKPENIMIDEDGRVVVMDFGLARRTDTPSRLTQTGTFLGTPEYASPEQCETRNLTPATDVYSLGVVMYEMLTGCVPFEAETPLALFARIVREEPQHIRQLNPNITDRTADLIMRLLAKDPAKRPTAKDVLDEILAILKELPADTAAATVSINVADPTSRTGLSVPTRRIGVRRRVAVALGGVAVAIALVVAVLMSGAVGSSEQKPRKGPAAHKSAPPLVAVAPAQNMTKSAELRWLCGALADMLSADLAQLEYLRVVAPEKLSETAASPAEAARKLGAALLVEARFWLVGNRLRVMAQTHRLKDGVILASAVAEDDKDAVFAVVDSVVVSLHTQLAKKLGFSRVAKLSWLSRYAALNRKHPPLPPQGRSALAAGAAPSLKKNALKKRKALSNEPVKPMRRELQDKAESKKGAGKEMEGLAMPKAEAASRGAFAAQTARPTSASVSPFRLLKLAYSLPKLGGKKRTEALRLLKAHLKRIPPRFRKKIEDLTKRYER